ncbi:MAG: hypothetical protein WCQ32_00195 [bacterium]
MNSTSTVNNEILLSILCGLDYEKIPLYLKVSSVVKDRLCNLKQWRDEKDFPNDLAIDTDLMDVALEDRNTEYSEEGNLAYLYITLISTKHHYFWMEYIIKSTGMVQVGWDTVLTKHDDFFERFTGKREVFEISVADMVRSINHDITIAETINKKVSEHASEYGDIETLDDVEYIVDTY